MDHKTIVELCTTLWLLFLKPFTIDFPFEVCFIGTRDQGVSLRVIEVRME
jgi:hypothetical protein